MSTPLHGFPAADWGVDIIVGPTPERLDDPTRDDGFMQMAPGEFLALIDGIGRMHVTADRVTLQPEPGHSLAEMDYLVYGWAPRWIRILRREYSLHASAVAVGEGAVAVMGFTGAGKSTTVTGLSARGYDLIVDDIVPVDFVDGRPLVHGWARPVHLTDQAAAHFRMPDSARVGTRAENKVAATLPSVIGSRPLRLAVELRVDDAATQVTSWRLAGAERLRAILDNSNTTGASAADGRAVSFFDWATRLASSIEVIRVQRPTQGWFLDAVLDQICDVIDPTDGDPLDPLKEPPRPCHP